MICAVGLGNIGEIYDDTRHNTGFKVLDIFKEDNDFPDYKKAKNFLYSKKNIFNNDVVLVKPTTFVNLSGRAILELINYYHINAEDLLVIYDDMDILPGDIKLKMKGESAGHNGIKSIISALGSETFNRIKVGIGRAKEDANQVDFVLGHFEGEEEKRYLDGVDKAVLALSLIIKYSFSYVLNRHSFKDKK